MPQSGVQKIVTLAKDIFAYHLEAVATGMTRSEWLHSASQSVPFLGNRRQRSSSIIQGAIAKEGYCSSVTKKKIIIACILNTRRRGIKLLHFL
jgi:hypothetical protein